MTGPDSQPRRVPPEDEPDFAEEHTEPTFEGEQADQPAVSGDEAVPEGPAGEDDRGTRPL